MANHAGAADGAITAAPLDQNTQLAADRTQLAGTRTSLALTRNMMAAERTLLAWIRTSLAMISFGFTIGKLGPALESPQVDLFGRTTDALGVAYYLVFVGTIALVLAAVQFKSDIGRFVPRGAKRRPSVAFVLAVLLSLLGMFVLTDLVGQL